MLSGIWKAKQPEKSDGTGQKVYGLVGALLRGRQEWRENGELHREDGPAIKFKDGTRMWYRHGRPHREDGPAAEFADGIRSWYRHGQLHREDGPAIETPDGSEVYYLHGVEVDAKEVRHLAALNSLAEVKLDVPEKLSF